MKVLAIKISASRKYTSKMKDVERLSQTKWIKISSLDLNKILKEVLHREQKWYRLEHGIYKKNKGGRERTQIFPILN